MIRICVNTICNIGIETLWLLLGYVCSYYSVSLANDRVNSSIEQCIGLVWLRIKSICVISRKKKKLLKLVASYKSGVSWPLAWLLPIQVRLHFLSFLIWPRLPTCRFRGSLLHVITHTQFSVFAAHGNNLNRNREWMHKSDQCVAEVTSVLYSRCSSHINTSVYLSLVNITFCKTRIVKWL